MPRLRTVLGRTRANSSLTSAVQASEGSGSGLGRNRIEPLATRNDARRGRVHRGEAVRRRTDQSTRYVPPDEKWVKGKKRPHLGVESRYPDSPSFTIPTDKVQTRARAEVDLRAVPRAGERFGPVTPGEPLPAGGVQRSWFRAQTSQKICSITVVGEGGLEPPHPFGYRHLKPARLPISPLALGPGYISPTSHPPVTTTLLGRWPVPLVGYGA